MTESQQIQKEMLGALYRLYNAGLISQETYIKKLDEIHGMNLWEEMHYVEMPPSRLSDVDEF